MIVRARRHLDRAELPDAVLERAARQNAPAAEPERAEAPIQVEDDPLPAIESKAGEQKSVIDGAGGPSMGHGWPVTGPRDREHRP
jgi:hypothetical protein